MRYKELITAIAEQINQPKWVVKKTIDAFIDTLKTELKKPDTTIFLSEFGKFQTRWAKAQNLDALPISYNGVSDFIYKRIYFHPYKKLKKSINE